MEGWKDGLLNGWMIIEWMDGLLNLGALGVAPLLDGARLT